MSNETQISDNALNGLLNQVPDIAPSPALHAKILAAATATQPQSAKVIDFPQKTIAREAQPSAGYNWLAGGFMAASLALGVWIGTAGLVDTLISAPLEFAGLQTTSQDNAVSVDDLIGAIAITEGAL